MSGPPPRRMTWKRSSEPNAGRERREHGGRVADRRCILDRERERTSSQTGPRVCLVSFQCATACIARLSLRQARRPAASRPPPGGGACRSSRSSTSSSPRLRREERAGQPQPRERHDDRGERAPRLVVRPEKAGVDGERPETISRRRPRSATRRDECQRVLDVGTEVLESANAPAARDEDRPLTTHQAHERTLSSRAGLRSALDMGAEDQQDATCDRAADSHDQPSARRLRRIRRSSVVRGVERAMYGVIALVTPRARARARQSEDAQPRAAPRAAAGCRRAAAIASGARTRRRRSRTPRRGSRRG